MKSDNDEGNANAYEYLTVDEVAQRLRVVPATVQRALREGRMPGFKRLNRWLVPAHDLSEWLDAGGHFHQPSSSDPMPRTTPRRSTSRFRAKLQEIEAGEN